MEARSGSPRVEPDEERALVARNSDDGANDMNTEDDTSEDDNMSDAEEDSAPDSEPSAPPPPRRPVRSTRGRRMRQLVGEEAEADDLFWNQKAFADEGHSDSDFSETSSS